ncbi:DUF177 domain-containing protein [Paenibacillus sp. LMG 31456]|uniref:DUF177 domain-containing protein n=1 Tax=Paenibacillus foliorum TaxID=2654974 RepID=A0A972GME9_9BACL|nr:DUF177 domain-containing protein [Paenibacillus foliorum]NOU93476.1 DUF177 domain-containing protein [Paenibacillus foliorum]
MFIRLRELAQKADTVHIDEVVDLTDVFMQRNDLLGFGPLHVKLHAQYQGEVAEVTGELSIEVEQPCSRCLVPVKQKHEIPFHETFARAADESKPDDDDEFEYHEDDYHENEEIHYVKDEKIELLPYVLENVVLALPLVPLCGEDCQGLCPVCGTNRNEHACGCKQDTTDPRLAGLADFFKE